MGPNRQLLKRNLVTEYSCLSRKGVGEGGVSSAL